jgi:tRNA uridine 5-carbamoylmethylation protein Kti12
MDVIFPFKSLIALRADALSLYLTNPQHFVVEVLVANSNSELLIKQALEFKPNAVVIVDETNLISEKRKALIDSIKETVKSPIRFHALYFNTPADICIERRANDNKGMDSKRWESVITKMAKNIDVVDCKYEGFSDIVVVDYFANNVVEEDLSTVIKYQTEFCANRKLPLLMPLNGICYGCKTNLFKIPQFVESMKDEHITRCSICGKSFC